jgi:hypothetical protein
VLLERSDRLGGQMALAQTAPGTAEIGRQLVALFEGRIADAGVDVRLGTEAELGAVLAFEPDAVVVATGARPYVPDLSLDGVEVAQSWDVLAAVWRRCLTPGCLTMRVWVAQVSDTAGFVQSLRTGAAIRPDSMQPRCSRSPAMT